METKGPILVDEKEWYIEFDGTHIHLSDEEVEHLFEIVYHSRDKNKSLWDKINGLTDGLPF